MTEFSESAKVVENKTLGRYVVAKKSLKAGEAILEETPILIIPQNNELRCDNCFVLTESQCSKCRTMPLCPNCLTHNHFECNFLVQNQINSPKLFSSKNNCYAFFKYLLLKENVANQERAELLSSLNSHLEQRKTDPLWLQTINDIAKHFLDSKIGHHFKATPNINCEIIQTFYGVMDTNSFEIRAPDTGSMRGIYFKAALLSHDCTPNTLLAVHNTHRMKIYVNKDVENGAILTNSYTSPLLGTKERSQFLQTSKYFLCSCSRCQDPTELGSHMSSLICSHCENGILTDRLNRWICDRCSYSMDSKDVNQILDHAKLAILEADGDIKAYEILIIKLLKILHPHHYLIIDLKQNVASILRTFLNNPNCTPGKPILDRKVTLCRDIIEVLRIVQPGISRMKGIALYEMYIATTELHRLEFHLHEISKKKLLIFLKEAELILREAIKMLLYEPVSSPEGLLTKTMLMELRDLQKDMEMLSK